MKICAACLEELPKDGFSKKQWQRKRYRRCKGCIEAADRVVQLDAPPKDNVRDEPLPPKPDEESASCWFCQDEGPDDDGHPLRRDCSCRGSDAGFAHLSCIVDYAKHKSANWDGRKLPAFSEPWWGCPNCHQDFQGDLAVELVTEFASFAEETYSDDKPRLLEALCTKVRVLSMHDAHLEDAKRIGERILSDIDQMRGANRLLPGAIGSFEFRAYNHLGYVALREGGNDGAKRAVECYEKCRAICQEWGWEVLIARTETKLAAAKTLLEGDWTNNIEEQIEKLRAAYKLQVAKKQPAVQEGRFLAQLLYEADRVLEAKELWTKLVATSKRVYGPDHPFTKAVAEGLEECRLSRKG